MRNESPSRSRMHSLQSVNAKRNEGLNAGQGLQNPHSQHTRMINASPSRERMQPTQPVAQKGRFKSSPAPRFQKSPASSSYAASKNSAQHNAMRNASPSRARIVTRMPQHQNSVRNASPSRERMPPNSTRDVQHSGYTQAPQFNQAPAHTPRQPSLYHDGNHQQSPHHDPHYAYGGLQSNSFSSASNQSLSTRSRQATTHPFPQNLPSTGSNQSVSHINHHPQHHMYNSHQSPAAPMRGHYAEHQRPPAQNSQAKQPNNMRMYQNNHPRH